MIEQWDKLDAFQDSMGSHFNDAEYSLGLFMEVAELVDSMNWKPWRDDRCVIFCASYRS